MFFRFLLLALIVFIIARAIRSRLLRKYVHDGAADMRQDLGVDPEMIKDAEFTEVSDTEETGR